MKLIVSEIRHSMSTGHQNSLGYVVALLLPTSMILPSDVSGGFTPRPKNDSAASASTAPPTANVAFTMMGPKVLGKMCRKIMRGAEAPTERAASTNSFSRSDKNSPRITRAIPIHPKNARNSASQSHVEPFTLRCRAATAARYGMTNIRSVKRISTASVKPRK